MKPQKPQSSQRKFLCTKNEYPYKDITRDISSCEIELHSILGPG